MSNFDDLMNSLGVKPIKKDKKEHRDTCNTAVETQKIETQGIASQQASPQGIPLKAGNKKEDVSDSFEEALKLYNPEFEEENFSGGKTLNKRIFHEVFSDIEEEDILHTIDLHGKTLDNAIALVRERLVWCYREKFDIILIITGKGNHSDNGPVLKIGIKNLLINMANLVEKVEYAPKMLGGEGAYVVRIKL